MSYIHLNSDLKARMARFPQDVFAYLRATGKEERGRTYFGVQAANNPNLVSRLEAGKPPSLEVMLRVWAYMEENPPPQTAHVPNRSQGGAA